MKLSERFKVPPGRKVRLAQWDPDDTAGFADKHSVESKVQKNLTRLSELEYILYAENKPSILIILQAMDAGGKDGTIRHVTGALNPQSCTVIPFKKPCDHELAHDFLWRIHQEAPRKGEIRIFNRSHYEDVLIVRVHNLVPKSVWSQRYDQINAFEQILAWQRYAHPEVLPPHQPRGATGAAPGPAEGPDQAVEDRSGRFRRAEVLGRLHAGL